MKRTCAFCGGTIHPHQPVVSHKEVSWPADFRVWAHATRCKGASVIYPIAPTSLATPNTP